MSLTRQRIHNNADETLRGRQDWGPTTVVLEAGLGWAGRPPCLMTVSRGVSMVIASIHGLSNFQSCNIMSTTWPL